MRLRILRACSYPRNLPLAAILSSCLAICLTSGSVMAGSYMESKKVAGCEIFIRIDRDPPIVGENNIEIEIKEAKGQNVSDAAVLVNYYMPPMPRMAPMNYKTEALYRNGKYKAVLRFIMEGPWVIAVKISRPNRTITAKFNLQVR